MNQGIKAEQIVERLKIFYKVGMTSFLHHIDHNHLTENKSVGVAKIRQHPEIEMMQFPDPEYLKWNVNSDCIKEQAVDDEMTSQLSNEQNSGGGRRGSLGGNYLGSQESGLLRKNSNRKSMAAKTFKPTFKNNTA